MPRRQSGLPPRWRFRINNRTEPYNNFNCYDSHTLSTSKGMQITYELTQRDFRESFIGDRKGRPLLKWFCYLVAIVLTFLVGLGLIMVAIHPSVQPPSYLFEFLGLGGLWCMLWWGYPWWLARTQFQKKPSAQGLRTVLFDREGIHSSWDGGSGHAEWRNYVRWIETRNEIVLYTSPVQFGIVPKRALNAEQLSELRALLTQNIGNGLRV